MLYGFDIGGTKIEFCVFDATQPLHKLQPLYKQRVATPTQDYQALLDTVVNLVVEADKQFNTQGKIGIGIPGIEDAQTREVLTVNVPAANGRCLGPDLEAQLARPVVIENDANCFALSESHAEHSQGMTTVLGVILGTGCGTGIVHQGRVVSGKNHMAGEYGHTRLPIDAWWALGDNAPLFDCGCGKQGCLDAYLSGRGFEKLYQAYYQESLSAEDIVERFTQQDRQACEHVTRFMSLLSKSLASIVTLLDPDIVVFGGGLSNFQWLIDNLPRAIQPELLPGATPPLFAPAKFGDSGGVRGAAFLNLPAEPRG